MSHTHVVFQDLDGDEFVLRVSDIHVGRDSSGIYVVLNDRCRRLEISEETYYRLREELTGIPHTTQKTGGKDPYNPWTVNIPDKVIYGSGK